MTMKKKILTTLSVVLILGLAALGILAYLSDTDSDVNVMTLGNVQIDQIEQEWNADKTELVDFTQAKPLYPYVGTLGWETPNQDEAYRTFTMNNVLDKYVSVKNTGKSEAYVRTIFAFEMGEYDKIDDFYYDVIGTSNNAADGAEFDFPGTWVWGAKYVAQIDGKNYMIWEAVHNAPLAVGSTTIPSLLQVYMNKDCGNEEVKKLDGNGNGTYDILVLSQAVQAEGFDTAAAALTAGFGEANATNVAKWFAGDEFEVPQLLYSEDDIWAAYGEDGNYVIDNNISTPNMLFFGVNTDVTLDLNGNTIDFTNKGQYAFAAPDNSTLHLTGNGTVNMGKGFFAPSAKGEIIIDGGTYNMTETETLNGVKLGSLVQNNGKIIINGGTFNTNVEDSVLFWATSNARIEINGGFFENTVDKTPDLLGVHNNKYDTNRIVITGGTFVNYNPLDDQMCYKGAWPANGEAAFSGPWILIPGDYKVVSETQSNGDVWYSVVPK